MYLASVNGGGGVGPGLGLHWLVLVCLGLDQFEADLDSEHLSGCVPHGEVKLVTLVNLLVHFP